MRLFLKMVRKYYTIILLAGDQDTYDKASEALEAWLRRLATSLECDRQEALRYAMEG